MRRPQTAWAIIAILCGPAGIAIGKLRLIAPTPGTFFALGVMATLCVGGVVFGIWDARRAAKSGRLINN